VTLGCSARTRMARIRLMQECSAVETVPGETSEAPVIRGTRVRPEDLVANRLRGCLGWSKTSGFRPRRCVACSQRRACLAFCLMGTSRSLSNDC